MIENTIPVWYTKENAIAITGHRVVKDNFDYVVFHHFLVKVLEKGYNKFYIGMAVGFDTLVFKALLKLKEQYDIKLIACIPCKDQDKLFTPEQKKEYRRLIAKADFRVVFYENYTHTCMQERNEFMVDNCSHVLSYMYKNSGGTFNTCTYATKKGVPIYNVRYLFEEAPPRNKLD